ncbi:unnamed protein product [Schistosoma margrebowiei]|uniref:Uncharacterized protein n=1 Tax=Schistosoma margrebowiei TaxID=48269 RepID=A0A183N8H7_9TREM|nr:unnamed protein product [Schistosoma margrebowiei]
MVVGGSQQETLEPGFVLLDTCQQGVPVILRELVLPDGFDLASPSFTFRDVTSELSGTAIQNFLVSNICLDKVNLLRTIKLLKILVYFMNKN